MKPSKSQQKPTLKPLTIAQENAIDLLITGRTIVTQPKLWV